MTGNNKIKDLKRKALGMLNKKIDAENKLIDISDSMCLAKWGQISFNVRRATFSSCCLSTAVKIDKFAAKKDYNYLFQNIDIIKQKKNMISGEKDSSCDFCWQIEKDTGKVARERVYKSLDVGFGRVYDEVKSKTVYNLINPNYLEVSFSNECNFRCIYCYPFASSRLEKESNTFGPYSTSDRKNSIEMSAKEGKENKDELIPVFWKWFETNAYQLETLCITGGEPTMQPNAMKLIDHLAENKYGELDLKINTNLSSSKDRMDSFLLKLSRIPKENVKSITLFVSLDSIGRGAEFVRDGLDFEFLQSNVRYVLEKMPHILISFTCTFSVFSFFGYDKLIDYILSLKEAYGKTRQIYLVTYPIRNPRYLRLSLLNRKQESYKEVVQSLYQKASFLNKQKIHGKKSFTDFEFDMLERVIKSFDEAVTDQDVTNFYWYINEISERRGIEHYTRVFPELLEFNNFARKLCLDEVHRIVLNFHYLDDYINDSDISSFFEYLKQHKRPSKEYIGITSYVLKCKVSDFKISYIKVIKSHSKIIKDSHQKDFFFRCFKIF